MAATIIAELTKEIKLDCETGDYACYITLDGERELIGFASTYSAAETKCAQYAYDYYADNNTPEVAAEIVLSMPIEQPEPSLLMRVAEFIDQNVPKPRDTQWLEVETPLIELPDGTRIYGTHDTDGSHFSAALSAPDGCFFCSYEDGSVTGDWAGVPLWSVSFEQIKKLRAFFASPMLDTLIGAAQSWCEPVRKAA